MEDIAIVETYIGFRGFKDTDAGVYCKAFSEFNIDENQKTVTAAGEIDEDGWEVNQLEPLGFVQIFKAATATEKLESFVSCAVASSRTDTAPGHAYKVGDTIKVNSGYKIRSALKQPNSEFALDSPTAIEFKLEAAARASALASAALSALAAATILAF